MIAAVVKKLYANTFYALKTGTSLMSKNLRRSGLDRFANIYALVLSLLISTLPFVREKKHSRKEFYYVRKNVIRSSKFLRKKNQGNN